jgi:hypothetical protein
VSLHNARKEVRFNCFGHSRLKKTKQRNAANSAGVHNVGLSTVFVIVAME